MASPLRKKRADKKENFSRELQKLDAPGANQMTPFVFLFLAQQHVSLFIGVTHVLNHLIILSAFKHQRHVRNAYHKYYIRGSADHP